MQAHTYLLVAKRKEELTLERLEAFKKRNTNAYKDCISKASQEMNQTNQAETIFALEHMDIKIDQYLAAMAKHAPEKKFQESCEKADMAMRSRLNPRELNMDRDSTKRIYV